MLLVNTGAVIVVANAITHRTVPCVPFEDKSSMTEQDAVEYICNLPQIVNAYDSVHYTEEQYGKTNLRGFLFKKQFADGQYASVEIISKKKSELQMRTTYMVSSDYKKKKATTNTVLMQNAASITSETPAGSSPSVNSIDDIEKIVKGNGTKNSTSATDGLDAVLEEIAKENTADGGVKWSRSRRFTNNSNIDESGKVKYNSSIKWVYDAGLFDGGQARKFFAAVADIQKRGHRFYQKARNGDKIVEVDNMLVYFYNGYQKPKIRKIIKFDTNLKYEIWGAREILYDFERGQYSWFDALQIIESVYGEEFVSEYEAESYKASQEKNEQREGFVGRESSKNSKHFENRRGNDSKSGETDNLITEADSDKTEAAFSLPEDGVKKSTSATDGLGAALDKVAKENTAEGGVKRSNPTEQHINMLVGKLKKFDFGEGEALEVAKFLEQDIESFDIEHIGDYMEVQRKVMEKLRAEGFFTESDNKSRIEQNQESGMIVEINQSGINETFNEKNYSRVNILLKLFKLSTIRMVPDIIKSGHVLSVDNENIHEGRTVEYAYIEKTVFVGVAKLKVKLAVRQSLQKNKFWVHDIHIEKATIGVAAGVSENSKTAQKAQGGENNISQNREVVKENGTKKSTSATDELDAVLEEIAKEEEREVKSVARELVRREQGAKADGRRYTMSLDTFEQVANSYAADIADESARKKFVKKLFDATEPLAAAHRSHGDAKAAFYDKAWRGIFPDGA